MYDLTYQTKQRMLAGTAIEFLDLEPTKFGMSDIDHSPYEREEEPRAGGR